MVKASKQNEDMMKYLLLALIGFSVIACSSNQYNDYSDLPNSKMLVDKEMSAMTRQQIITAVEECHAGFLIPVMIYTKRKINGQISEAVVDVTCRVGSSWK
jgi:hypothetical protein